MPDQPHVVILGVGFGGLGALRALEKAPVRVTLVDRNDYHTFLPLLYQVATAELLPGQVGFPAEELIHRPDWTFRQADVTGIDVARRQVLLGESEPMEYDYLVMAPGAIANFFGTTGAAEHAFPLYSMRDAQRLKEHVFDRLEAAKRDQALIDDGALNFCVVGGGATGVEIAGALSELLTEMLREEYAGIPAERTQVHLYELGPHLLAPFKSNLQEYAKRALEKRDVQVHLGEGVAQIAPTRVRLNSGGEVKAHTLIWAAGIKANPIVESLGGELASGRVVATPDLSMAGHPEVFVIGDSAVITDAATGDRLPQLGSVALQAGQCAGENIARLVKGQKSRAFKYKDKGTMAAVGHGAAVVEFRRGRTMTGHAAWLTWLGVHLMLLSGGEQKSLTFVDWGLGILTNERRRYRVPAR